MLLGFEKMMYTIYFAQFVFSLLTLTLTVRISTSPTMNCGYAPLGSISAIQGVSKKADAIEFTYC